MKVGIFYFYSCSVWRKFSFYTYKRRIICQHWERMSYKVIELYRAKSLSWNNSICLNLTVIHNLLKVLKFEIIFWPVIGIVLSKCGMSLVPIKVGTCVYGKQGTTKWESISKSGSKDTFFKNFFTYEDMNMTSEEAPINPNKWFNNKLSQIINYSFFISDHSSGSRTTSRDAHNRLNILHLTTFKQAIVFTAMVVKKEKSLSKYMHLVRRK